MAKESVISPEQREEENVHQFETRVASLAETGITEHGFTMADRFPVPTVPQFLKILRGTQNQELVTRKTGQGLTRLDLTPFGAPTTYLLSRIIRVLKVRDKKTLVFHSKRDNAEPNHPANVDTTTPVWIEDGIESEIDREELVYFPTSFTDNHGGKTKAAILTDPAICAIPGWSIRFSEPAVIIPLPDQVRSLGGRSQLPTNMTPHDYLAALRNPMYAGETGRTIEDFLTDFAVRLHETGQVSFDWNQRSALWLIGNLDPQTGCVLRGNWDRGEGRLRVVVDHPGDQFGNWGAAPTVRLVGV